MSPGSGGGFGPTDAPGGRLQDLFPGIGGQLYSGAPAGSTGQSPNLPGSGQSGAAATASGFSFTAPSLFQGQAQNTTDALGAAARLPAGSGAQGSGGAGPASLGVPTSAAPGGQTGQPSGQQAFTSGNLFGMSSTDPLFQSLAGSVGGLPGAAYQGIRNTGDPGLSRGAADGGGAGGYGTGGYGAPGGTSASSGGRSTLDTIAGLAKTGYGLYDAARTLATAPGSAAGAAGAGAAGAGTGLLGSIGSYLGPALSAANLAYSFSQNDPDARAAQLTSATGGLVAGGALAGLGLGSLATAGVGALPALPLIIGPLISGTKPEKFDPIEHSFTDRLPGRAPDVAAAMRAPDIATMAQRLNTTPEMLAQAARTNYSPETNRPILINAATPQQQVIPAADPLSRILNPENNPYYNPVQPSSSEAGPSVREVAQQLLDPATRAAMERSGALDPARQYAMTEFKEGGTVGGYGDGGSVRSPMRLPDGGEIIKAHEGEFVVKREHAERYRDLLEGINAGLPLKKLRGLFPRA